MLKKMIIGLLIVTVVGGAVFALTDNQNPVSLATAAPTAVTNQQGNGNGQAGNGNVQSAQAAQAAQATQQPVQASISSVGDPWSGSGTIRELTTVGMNLTLDDGSEVYVELGPQDYWQAQGLTLNVGDTVAVEGFFNGSDYHARSVSANGATLAVRDENGQPLWSGGSNASAGSNGGQGEVQIPADQWVTIDGTVTALTNNGLIVRTTDAQTLTVSFGRADFWQSQAVTFATGDAISMLGFWQGDQFSAGQVTKTATSERILLRDPNGRPLWAGRGQGNGGSGTSGQSSSTSNQTNASGKLATVSSQGNGNGGQGNGNSNGNGNGSQGNGNGGQGNGNGGRGNSNGNRGNGNRGQQKYATPTAQAAQ